MKINRRLGFLLRLSIHALAVDQPAALTVYTVFTRTVEAGLSYPVYAVVTVYAALRLKAVMARGASA